MVNGLNIGVTGHRFLAEEARISRGIDRALNRIKRTFHPLEICLYSVLGEGADQLAAERVLALSHASLVAVLPLSEGNLIQEFSSADIQVRFYTLLSRAQQLVRIPLCNSPEQAYQAAGWYVLDRCDILLAVWDGLPAQGMGGTGEVVVEARRRRRPLAWVMAGNRQPGTNTPQSLGKEQGKVVYERFPKIRKIWATHGDKGA
jgi:hypothetical protein